MPMITCRHVAKNVTFDLITTISRPSLWQPSFSDLICRRQLKQGERSRPPHAHLIIGGCQSEAQILWWIRKGSR